MSVTREEVAKFYEKYCADTGAPPFTPEVISAAILAALNHFAPPIARMSVKEIEREMGKSEHVFLRHEVRVLTVGDAAEIAHRLAQPARVDADARAKELNWERCQCFDAQPPGPDAAWEYCTEAEKNFWRKQAAKEAGDAE